MKKAMTTLAMGLLVYILAKLMITSLVTGTTSGDVVIQTILPIAIAFGLVILTFSIFLGGGTKS